MSADEMVGIGLEESGRPEIDFVGKQGIGRFVENPLAEILSAFQIPLQLNQHGRHQVEGHLDSGKLFEQMHHSVVILEPVQPEPGKGEFGGDRVPVIGLMHVPEDGQINFISPCAPV